MEYSLKEKLSCVACHVTPWGGGPRNVMGKNYGTRGMGTNPLTALDYFYGDLRFIGYYPTRPDSSTTTNGVALMEAAVTGNAPVSTQENGAALRALLTYQISPLAGANVREAYLRWNTATAEPSALPIYFVLGLVQVPFGILTDEHRTYTRLQTNMTFNNSFLSAGVSADLSQPFHADFVLSNDFQNLGGFNNSEVSVGFVGNFRWNPPTLPFLLGVSGNYEHLAKATSPYAVSFYTGLSLDRLGVGGLKGSLLFERVDAWNWNNAVVNTGGINPGLNTFFIPTFDASYRRAVQTTSSAGYFGQFKYDLSTAWTLFYKLDYLALDKSVSADAFYRHGFGFETRLGGNLILNARYEFAAGMRPEIQTSQVLASQDDFFAMLRLWI